MERLFQALADGTRIRLLNVLGEDEVCVCFLVAALRMPQPTISRHLAYLKRAGLVSARREGKWMHYRRPMLADPQRAAIVKDAMEAAAADRSARSDRERFQRACCSPQLIATKGVPIPVRVNGRERR